MTTATERDSAADTKDTPPGVFATLRATPTSVRYLLGGVLINQAGAFVQPFLVLYLVHRGVSVGRAGLTLGIYSLGAMLGMLVGGELTHRLGARRTIAVSMATSALLVSSLPATAAPDRYWLLLVAVALTGAATQSYRPAAATLLSDLMPERDQVMAFSMFRIALNIGAAIGPLLAAWLILLNWDLLFWVDGLTALAYSALALALLPKTAPGRRHGDSKGASMDARHVTYLVVFRDRKFMLYLTSMFLGAAVYVQFYAVLPLKITHEGHPESLYSAVLTLSSAILIACELKVTWYVKRWLVASVAGGVGMTLLSLGVAGYGVSGSGAAILLFTVVFVSGLMVGGPTRFAHPAKAPADRKGRYLGMSQAVFGAGMALGPTVGVFVWNRLGDGVWLLGGVVGLVAAACGVIGMREPSNAAHVPAP